MKINMQMYNYIVLRIKGKKNEVADLLSRRPSWFAEEEDEPEDAEPDDTDMLQNLVFEEGALSVLTLAYNVSSEEDCAMRTMVAAPHLIKDNPEFKRLEEVGFKDADYQLILHHLRTNTSYKHLPVSSEGRLMGGEWSRLEILSNYEIVTYMDANGLSRIYPPAAYREKIIESLHVGGRKEDSMSIRCRLHFYWPKMRAQLAKHVQECKSCHELQPSKP